MELRAHERYRVALLVRRDFCPPLPIEAEDAKVIDASMNQNFVSIVDGRGALCGILECIILSVKDTYMDAGGYAHD